MVADVTANDVRSALHYDAVTGEFTWRPRAEISAYDKCFNKRFAGKLTGAPCKEGYLQIGFKRKIYYAHRLAFLYVHGRWPLVIDHIDGVKTNNAIANLREATFAENSQNTSAKSKKAPLGVDYMPKRQKWCAQIGVGYKRFFLGHFDSEQEAAAAYRAAKANLHTFSPSPRAE